MFPNISLFPGEMFPNIPKHSCITEENPMQCPHFWPSWREEPSACFSSSSEISDLVHDGHNKGIRKCRSWGLSFYKKWVKVLGLHMIAHRCPWREATELKRIMFMPMVAEANKENWIFILNTPHFSHSNADNVLQAVAAHHNLKTKM